MILQALHQLAEQEMLVPDPDYEERPIAWLVRVSDDGKLLGIESTHVASHESSDTGSSRRARAYPVPREPMRTSGAYAFFLFDKAEYVFGIDPTGKRSAKKLTARAALFRDKIRDCYEVTHDEAVGSVLKCVNDIHKGKQVVSLPEDCAGNDLFAFVYAPEPDRLVTDRPVVGSYWKDLRAEGDAGGTTERCLVTGQISVPVKKHPPVRRVPGGNTSGVALVSFNENAFESYGRRRNENAPISRGAAESYVTALNRLLHPAFPDPGRPGQSLPRRNLRLSADTVVCYWAMGKRSEEFLTCFGPLLQANPDEVKTLYQSIWRGIAPQLDDPSAFYALTLSGAQGRATVRDWFESTVDTVANNLAQHFADLSVVRKKPKSGDLPPQIPLRVLLESLAPLGKRDEIPPHLAGHLLHAALRGIPYPLAVLHRAIQRMRVEIGKDDWSALQRRDARVALIKAVLNRRKRFHPETTRHYKEVRKEMDPTNTSPGYLLGRLMAIIERMQRAALGEVGSTVVDRYFSGASAAPQATFPRLLKSLRHHASKAKDNEGTRSTAGWLEHQADEILAMLPAFPSSLDLEQQGLFVLGYHHQRHWLWMGKEEREQWEAA